MRLDAVGTSRKAFLPDKYVVNARYSPSKTLLCPKMVLEFPYDFYEEVIYTNPEDCPNVSGL